jgi:hypothetical protein
MEKNNEILKLSHDNVNRLINVISKFEGVNYSIPQTDKIIKKERDNIQFRNNYDYRVI